MRRHTKRLRSLAVLTTLGLTLGFMAGCSGDKKAEEKPSASASQSPTQAPESPIQEAEAPPTSSEAPAQPTANLADAFSGYGTDSVETTAPTIPGTFGSGEYIAQNAKRDILIAIWDNQVWIYSGNWNLTRPYGTMPETGLPANGIFLEGGKKTEKVAGYDEWPQGMPAEAGGDFREAQVLENGQIIKLGNYVCGSNDKGVTCWSIETGHGAFVTDSAFAAF